MKPDWPNTQSHTLTTTTHIHPNTCLIISCTHMHTHTFSFSSPPLHTLTSLTLSVLWLFLGGLVLAAVFLWVCVCVLVRVSMHACMHAESISLYPVPHCLNTSLESFHCHIWILSLSLFLGGWFWLMGGRRAGLPPVRPSDWSASCHQNQPSLFGGFCEWVRSGGPHRDVLFQVYSLKGAHEMVDFPGHCHVEILFLFLFVFFSFISR